MENMRAGVIAAAVWNAAGGIREREGAEPRKATPHDFFRGLPKPGSEPAPRKQTMEEQIAIWKAMGAKDLRDTGD